MIERKTTDMSATKQLHNYTEVTELLSDDKLLLSRDISGTRRLRSISAPNAITGLGGTATASQVWVSEDGDDASGLPYRADRPFATLAAAKDAASAGDTVVVLPGSYPVGLGADLLKPGVNWHFFAGATVTSAVAEAIFNTDQNIGTVTISGDGKFIGNSGVVSIGSNSAGTTLYFSARNVQSTSAPCLSLEACTVFIDIDNAAGGQIFSIGLAANVTGQANIKLLVAATLGFAFGEYNGLVVYIDRLVATQRVATVDVGTAYLTARIMASLSNTLPAFDLTGATSKLFLDADFYTGIRMLNVQAGVANVRVGTMEIGSSNTDGAIKIDSGLSDGVNVLDIKKLHYTAAGVPSPMVQLAGGYTTLTIDDLQNTQITNGADIITVTGDSVANIILGYCRGGVNFDGTSTEHSTLRFNHIEHGGITVDEGAVVIDGMEISKKAANFAISSNSSSSADIRGRVARIYDDGATIILLAGTVTAFLTVDRFSALAPNSNNPMVSVSAGAYLNLTGSGFAGNGDCAARVLGTASTFIFNGEALEGTILCSTSGHTITLRGCRLSGTSASSAGTGCVVCAAAPALLTLERVKMITQAADQPLQGTFNCEAIGSYANNASAGTVTFTAETPTVIAALT